MGVWFHFRGGLQFAEPVDPQFKQFFNYYGDHISGNDPLQPYGTYCPWYIDENDELTCMSTKCGDHWTWLEYIASRFLTPFGIKAEGTLDYVVADVPTEEDWMHPEKWHINTSQYVKFANQDYIIMCKVLDEGKKYQRNECRAYLVDG